MTTPQPHTARPPTPKQLRYLRDLALRTGQSFTYPRSAGQASREIDRLKKLRRTPAAERRRELLQIQRDMTERRGDAAGVRRDEVQGYGSQAGWSTTIDGAEEESGGSWSRP